MAGKGKYTTYVSSDKAKNDFMKKLYGSHSWITSVDTQSDAIDAANALGNNVLRAGNTKGIVDTMDTSLGKVDLTFSGGGDSTMQPPEIVSGADGSWKQAGDPANSYVPDITSPGPGKAEGVDKVSDPKIKAGDIKPNLPIGSTTNGTRSPALVGPKVYAGNTLGGVMQMGKSGGD